MVITGEAVGQAVAIGVVGFVISLGAGLLPRGRTSRAENIRSSLVLGLVWGVLSLLAATVDLPRIQLEPPLSTILVVLICVAVTAGSVAFFRVMLRDGSRED